MRNKNEKKINELSDNIKSLNIRIGELNKIILQNNDIINLKEKEIQKQKDLKDEINKKYNEYNQNYIKFQNEILFYKQIINDKQNEISNLRKSNRLYDTKK